MRRQKNRVKEVFGAWERLAEGREPERLPRGSMIYTPAQSAQKLLLLTEGQVGLHLMGPEKRPLTLRLLDPGQLFGHVAAASSGKYDTFAEALTPVLVYQIDRTEVAKLMAEDGDFALSLLDDLGHHRLAVSRRLDEVGFKSVPARLASVLLDMAHDDNGQEAARVPRHSHRLLAGMINAYRETVTKVINQFRDARLLEVDGSSMTLVNRTRLEELAQGW